LTHNLNKKRLIYNLSFFNKKLTRGEDVFFIKASTSKSSTHSSGDRGRGDFNQHPEAQSG